MPQKLSIVHMSGTATANSTEDVKAILGLREEGKVNDFYISPASSAYPSLKVLVNSEYAHVTYFPEDGISGFVSIGDLEALKDQDWFTFYMDRPTQEMQVSADQVVLFSQALRATLEFFHNNSLPSSLKFMNLDL
jgi:hypothetical protein